MTPEFLSALRAYIHRVARVPVGVEFEADWQKVLAAVPKSPPDKIVFHEKIETGGNPMIGTVVYAGQPPVIPFPPEK